MEKAQTIFRVAKNPDNPFVMIDRRAVENPKLSWRAKGLLAYLLSRPDDWVVRFKDLAKRAPDGAHTVRAAMKELKAAGHVEVTTEREGGRIIKWTYNIHEVPHGGFQQVEKQEVENRTLNNKDKGNKKKSVSNTSGKPAADKPAKAKDFPSNILFHEVTERWPAKANWRTVLYAVSQIEKRLGRFPVRDDIFPFFEEWCARGSNTSSIKWLTDWATTGVIPTQRQNQQFDKGAQKHNNLMANLNSWLSEKESVYGD